MVLAQFTVMTLVQDLPRAAGSRLSQEAAEECFILGILQHLSLRTGFKLATKFRTEEDKKYRKVPFLTEGL